MAAAGFRLTSPQLAERDLHERCAQMLDALLLPPAVWATYPAGAAQLSPQQQARYSRIGLKRGWPDIIVMFNGCWGLELKSEAGRLSKTRVVRTRRGSPRILDGQEDVFPRLVASGGFAAISVVRSVEDMLAQLARWGIPLRPHTLSGAPAAQRRAERIFV